MNCTSSVELAKTIEAALPRLARSMLSLDANEDAIVGTLKQSLGTTVVNSGLLLMAVMGLLFPAAFLDTHSEVHFWKSELALSRFNSCIILIAYAAYLYYQLNAQNDQYVPLTE